MKPLEKIPEEMLAEYSMDGAIDVEYYYRDDSTEEIQAQMSNNFTSSVFNKYLAMAARRRRNYYGNTDTWLYQAIDKYGINGKSVCVFGSANPWYEAIAIQNGASLCHVLEYSPRESFDERIKYIQSDELIKYDVVFSISSFEHYGLGRYGDPIGPNDDIAAMQQVKDVLNDDGLLYLSVPIGVDKVYFNVLRVYGETRFPRLIDGFIVLDSFGVDDNSFKRTDNKAAGTPYQPIFILKKE